MPHATRHRRTWAECSNPVWAIILGLAFSAGCATPGPHATIPFGQWAGEGTVVYEDWNEQEKSPVQSIYRSYSTRMDIRPGVLDGRDIIEIDIRSDSGPLPDLDPETIHVTAALAEVRRLSDSAVLYQMVDLLLNPDAAEILEFDNDAPPLAATCMVMNGVTILQIEYMENYVDTLRFEGDQVEKTGVYFDRDEGLVHWVEHLKRQH